MIILERSGILYSYCVVIERDFTCATQLQPTNYLCFFKRGVASYKESEEEDAIRDLNKVPSKQNFPHSNRLYLYIQRELNCILFEP